MISILFLEEVLEGPTCDTNWSEGNFVSYVSDFNFVLLKNPRNEFMNDYESGSTQFDICK